MAITEMISIIFLLYFLIQFSIITKRSPFIDRTVLLQYKRHSNKSHQVDIILCLSLFEHLVMRSSKSHTVIFGLGYRFLIISHLFPNSFSKKPSHFFKQTYLKPSYLPFRHAVMQKLHNSYKFYVLKYKSTMK